VAGAGRAGHRSPGSQAAERPGCTRSVVSPPRAITATLRSNSQSARVLPVLPWGPAVAGRVLCWQRCPLYPRGCGADLRYLVQSGSRYRTHIAVPTRGLGDRAPLRRPSKLVLEEPNSPLCAVLDEGREVLSLEDVQVNEMAICIVSRDPAPERGATVRQLLIKPRDPAIPDETSRPRCGPRLTQRGPPVSRAPLIADRTFEQEVARART
jgi:hypothetical protein